MDRKETIAAAIELIRIQDEMGGENESRGEVVARLTGIDTTSDAFIAALRLVADLESPGVIYLPGVFEAVLNGFAFGVALAAHHKSKNQESANGS
jgi:hypothetical protein